MSVERKDGTIVWSRRAGTERADLLRVPTLARRSRPAPFRSCSGLRRRLRSAA